MQNTTENTAEMSSVVMMDDSIPNASEIVQVPEISPEERMIKELMRNGYIAKCRDFVFRYIRKSAGGKIVYRNSLHQNSAYIFRYSPPATRGVSTQYYSQVVYNTTTGGFSMDYVRPVNHDKEIWYFPVWYIMNGVTKTKKRQFQSIGLETVESMLRTLFESKQYGIKFYRNRFLADGTQTGNIVMVEWNLPEAENQHTDAVVTSNDVPDSIEAPVETDQPITSPNVSDN